MNRQSSIGLVLLVTMVLAKAYIPFNVENENPIQRNSSLVSSIQDYSEIRTNQESFAVNPTVHLIASNIITDYAGFSETKQTQIDNSGNSISENIEIYLVSNPESTNNLNVDDAQPLEAYTNTGYGLWKKPKETIKSFNDRPRSGDIPLDNGNTISDNISKLFPRTN